MANTINRPANLKHTNICTPTRIPVDAPGSPFAAAASNAGFIAPPGGTPRAPPMPGIAPGALPLPSTPPGAEPMPGVGFEGATCGEEVAAEVLLVDATWQ